MKRSLSTHNPYEIGGCEAADRLESRMKESTGISARTVPEFAELKWLGSVPKMNPWFFTRQFIEAILFSSMYAPIVLIGFVCVAFVGKKREDKFQCAHA